MYIYAENKPNKDLIFDLLSGDEMEKTPFVNLFILGRR